MEQKKQTHVATGQLLIFIDIWLVPLLLLLVVCYVSCAVTYTYVHVCACVFVCVYVCLERACMCACLANVCSQRYGYGHSTLFLQTSATHVAYAHERDGERKIESERESERELFKEFKEF